MSFVSLTKIKYTGAIYDSRSLHFWWFYALLLMHSRPEHGKSDRPFNARLIKTDSYPLQKAIQAALRFKYNYTGWRNVRLVQDPTAKRNFPSCHNYSHTHSSAILRKSLCKIMRNRSSSRSTWMVLRRWIHIIWVSVLSAALWSQVIQNAFNCLCVQNRWIWPVPAPPHGKST